MTSPVANAEINIEPPKPGAVPTADKDMGEAVQSILAQVQTRFQVMTDQVIEKIDGMGKRIDDLQTQIATLEEKLKEEEI
eukprot:CFRG0535T1